MSASFVVATNIISSLGFDTLANVAQVANGVSGIKKHEHKALFEAPFYSSLVDTAELDKRFASLADPQRYTRLEKMMILSLQDVIQATQVPLKDQTALIVSSTKGNIDALAAASAFDENRAYLSVLAQQLQSFFKLVHRPIVVSNACVSGTLSLAMAHRLIKAGDYKHVLIASGDIVSPFVLSGFTSFQAISAEACRPFSKNRQGITIGEAAASALVTADTDLLTAESVQIIGTGAYNDANHISGPSRTGEGLYRSIQSALKETGQSELRIDYISAHGTATNYNDEMEAIAVSRAGLQAVPLNSLKGYYGHTLGASGLLESIIGIHSLHQNKLFASAGFDELGVSENINVIATAKEQELNTFLKMSSGFGGCNTAVIFQKVKAQAPTHSTDQEANTALKLNAFCKITDNCIRINEDRVLYQEAPELSFAAFAKKVYKAHGLGYRKFFKMDNLSKLAFLAAEFLFSESDLLQNANPDDIAIVLSNRAASLDTDRKHQESIEDKDNYFPSPAVFVYTLANICIGEISIRHQLKTENAFCIFDEFNPHFLERYSRALIQQGKAKYVICGWADFDKGKGQALFYLLSEREGQQEFSKELLKL